MVDNNVPKNFMIRCPRCRWGRTSTGLKVDLKDLNEVASRNPGAEFRKFKCPKCGSTAVMKRINRSDTTSGS